MNNLTQAMDVDSNQTLTLNGMEINKSSQDAIVDLFFAVGASRGKNVTSLFEKALNANLDLAVRTALYARDIRGGMGERQLFRDMLRILAIRNPDTARRVVRLIPEIGRYDDLFAVLGTGAETDALNVFAAGLEQGDGLAFKWAPREKSVRKLEAIKLRRHLGLAPKQYRKYLTSHTTVVEQEMCAKKWDEIDFEHVPSLAHARYQNAFRSHQPARYSQYLSQVEEGTASIAAGAVYPYDIVKSLGQGEARAAEQQWNALPNWINSDVSFLPLVDTSGSMTCSFGKGSVRPIDISTSLGLYCAQRGKGPFRNRLITFSERPDWINVEGLSLESAVNAIKRANWGFNTNVEAAYRMILDVATKNEVPVEDMPDYLIIFSDMQFDVATRGVNNVYGNVKDAFEQAGYQLPNLVFWNLNDYQSNTPVKFDQRGTALVSGFSPSTMVSVFSPTLETFTPINIVLDAIMRDRYTWQ